MTGPARQSDDLTLDEAFAVLARELIAAIHSRPHVEKAIEVVCRHVASELAGRSEPVSPSASSISQTDGGTEPVREMTMRVAGEEIPVRGGDLPRVQAPASITGPQVVREAPYDSGWRSERFDLSLIQRRAKLKADAARWAIERRRRAAEGADHQTQIKPSDEDLVERARKLNDCRLWMLDPYQSCPSDDVIECIAGCYDTVAFAAEIVRAVMSEDDEDAPLDELFHLAAEAQSALRVALIEADIRNDRDQGDLFYWLRQQTEAKQVLVHRHMRLDDPADWREWLAIQDRLTAFEETRKTRRQRERERSQILNKVRFHLDKHSSALLDERHAHWRKIDEALAAWIEAGWQPSNRELVQMLYPALEELTDSFDFSPQARRVLEAVDRYAASREVAETDESATPPSRPREVLDAAELLRNRVVVMIGGDVRPQSKKRIERDLELRELRWVATKPHQDHASISPEVIRDDVDLVILNIRWTSHCYADFAEVCRAHDKPFVRLPAGYNPSQVARQVLDQVSQKLR